MLLFNRNKQGFTLILFAASRRLRPLQQNLRHCLILQRHSSQQKQLQPPRQQQLRQLRFQQL